MRNRRLLWLPTFLLLLALVGLPLTQVTDTGLERSLKDRLGIGLGGTGCEPEREQAGWDALPALPEPIDEPRATTVGGLVYIAGGIERYVQDERTGERQAVVTRDFRRFDPASGRYEDLAPLPRPLNHVGMVGYRGDVYLVGGHGRAVEGPDAIGELHRYDVRAGRWERLPSMPTPRGAMAAAVIGDRLYVAGGRNARGDTAALEAYDFATRRWQRLPSMADAREHVAAAVAGGALYVLGGRNERDYSLATAERYDPRRGRWERLADLPEPTGGAEAVGVAGDVLVLGGGDDREARVTGAVQRLDPARGDWAIVGTMRAPRHGFAATEVGGRVMTFGGSPCAYFAATDTADVLQPAALRRP